MSEEELKAENVRLRIALIDISVLYSGTPASRIAENALAYPKVKHYELKAEGMVIGVKGQEING